ncbi:MAG: methylated-DNA--[protein]-cysteine S-methyltransferase [Sulfuriferula sp.]
MHYQAIIPAPFAHLGVVFNADGIQRIDFLPLTTQLLANQHSHVQALQQALVSYWQDAHYQPLQDVPVSYQATIHQARVWQALLAIPSGQTRYYGEVAAQIASYPRAVGQACGANPLPILIPCHRVVGKTNPGGFMHSRDDTVLAYKQWLLAHER